MTARSFVALCGWLLVAGIATGLVVVIGVGLVVAILTVVWA